MKAYAYPKSHLYTFRNGHDHPHVSRPMLSWNHSVQTIDESGSSTLPEDLEFAEPLPMWTSQANTELPLESHERRSASNKTIVARATNSAEVFAAIATGAPIFQTIPVLNPGSTYQGSMDSILWSTTIGQQEQEEYSTTNLVLRIVNIVDHCVALFWGDGFNGFKFVTGVRFPLDDHQLVGQGLYQARATGRIKKIFLLRPNYILEGMNRTYWRMLISDLQNWLPPGSQVVDVRKYKVGLLGAHSRYAYVRELRATPKGCGRVQTRILDKVQNAFINVNLPNPPA